MHIAIVSAHYPPNFVSGGTLVPRRLAQTLAARGHQVSVFAGEVDSAQPDLMTRVEALEPDPAGSGSIEVTWVTVTGRLGWDDGRNFASDALTSIFLNFLRRVRPEVVHLHTLQGLGAGLVAQAASSGAATVVTMHDMWWWCARQFLVQENLRPCSTVVEAGICPCSVDNSWLRSRNTRLAAALATADLVLAPSTPMLSLLAANGVDPDRLALDENPSPESVRTTGPGAGLRAFDGQDVKFVFAGGPYPVKGGPLALSAAARLADLSGWSLDLYGIEPTARLPAHASALPPYPAAEVVDVLSGYDVLLMSSVMLESYSLLTREALAAGCVVITGDNPGPTEVVRNGVNGLVVPRGDEVALAAAMRSLVEDRKLLDRLRPAAGALELRSMADQADGLESHYRRIIAARDTAQMPKTPALQRVLLVSGIDGAPLRYRGWLPAEALAELGIHVDVIMYRDRRIPDLAASADAVVFYRVPATGQILDVIEQIRARKDIPLLFDIDDLVVDPGLSSELDPILRAVPGLDLDLYWQGVRRYRTTLEACDGYIGSTEYLCDRIGELTSLPTYRFGNGVGRELARVSDAQLRRDRKPGPLRVGYFSGTNTHNEDWAYIEPAVIRLLGVRPDVQVWIGGLLEPSDALLTYAGRIRRLPVTPWFALPALLRDLDVNLAPLEPGRTFNEAKSAIKFLEAALVGTPTVASGSQPFREAIQDRVTGLLADSPEEWLEAILALVDDKGLRSQIGLAARESVLTTLSPAQQGHRYRDILLAAQDRLRREGHRPAFTDWVPETLDEPFEPVTTQFYGRLEIRADGTARPATQRGVRDLVAQYAGTARRMLSEEGLMATAKRSLSVAARLRRHGLTRLRR